MIRGAWLTVLLLLASAPSEAKPAVGDAVKKDKEAREHYSKGMNLFNLGEFAAAVTEFKAAYTSSAAPGLLFNIGQAQRLNKDYEAALFSYQSYLRQVPKAPNRTDVEARVEEMKRALKEEEGRAATARREEAARREETARREEEARKAKEKAEEEARAARLGGEKKPVVVEPLPSGKVPFRVGIGALAVGVVAVGVGVVLGVQANATASELSLITTWDQSARDRYASGQGMATAASALLVIGAVAVVAGAAVAIFGWRRERARAAVPAVQAVAGGLRWAF